jgi:hypothetical protein
MWIAENHMRHVMYCEKNRWPGYYSHAGYPGMDEANWKYFLNCVRDPKTGQWTMNQVPSLSIFRFKVNM